MHIQAESESKINQGIANREEGKGAADDSCEYNILGKSMID